MKNVLLLIQTQVKKLTLPFALMGMASVILFSSCSEDVPERSSLAIPKTPLQQVKLAPDPTEWINIEGVSSSNARRATTAPGPDRGRFNISLDFVVPVTDRQEEVFEQAAARWERIIIKDVPSFTGTLPSAFGGLVVEDSTIDDIIIEVALAPIDGPGSILGQAGPRFVRTADNLTLSGVMFFDVADLDFLESLDLFEEVIIHEMGHVLGIGTLWNFQRELRQTATGGPYFTGKKANIHWNAEGGEDFLPIEGDFGPGTQFSHWDEATLNNELMTGFLNLGENPLSRITAGSLRDLGYGAAMVGDQYDLPKGTEGIDPAADGVSSPAAGINMASSEVLLSPIGSVTVK